ncbi:DUF3265 domain-containing protein [Vibrio alginolyticus]|nr:DUF3265 domain-containing protein [Vibrio alginolyticus]USD75631.1 DUF3265 domain-containing protein [Vibrio sp. SCSIO 43009]EIP0123115.1 DUF3265 domain-containing protein [Vibrio alginolyticus]EJI1385109.1 DUF3265 domain-containing protein [Vibrio alginolyticus]ELA7316818.1 DUF3265 domain-containing protein [Vibrio alginolyticus]
MTHPDILALRKLVKETQDAHAKAVLAHLEDNFIGFRVFLTRNVVFWYGVGFFLVVLHNPDWLFHYALNLVIKVVCGGIGIALLTP